MTRSTLVLVALLAGCSPTGPVADAGFTGDAPICEGCYVGCPAVTGRPGVECVPVGPAYDCSSCVPVCLEVDAVAECGPSGAIFDCYRGGEPIRSTPICTRR